MIEVASYAAYAVLGLAAIGAVWADRTMAARQRGRR